MPSPPARYIFKEAFVMEAANYALLAAAESRPSGTLTA